MDDKIDHVGKMKIILRYLNRRCMTNYWWCFNLASEPCIKGQKLKC